MAKSVTFKVSDELHKKMRKLNIINWSEVCRRAVEKTIRKMEKIGEVIPDG